MSELQERIAVIQAKQAAGEEIPLEELIEFQRCHVRELKAKLRDETAARMRAEAELRECREQLAKEGAIRPSIEVLQRMANGIDPFDLGRFRCAVAALPHETPKLSATMNQLQVGLSIGDRLDRANGRSVEQRARERGLVTIEGG